MISDIFEQLQPGQDAHKFNMNYAQYNNLKTKVDLPYLRLSIEKQL